MRQQERLRSLDSLRGIGALAVMIWHATWVAFGGANGPGILLIPRRGYLAVDLFFMLSGFVLAHVYSADFANRPSRRRYAAFIWARLARIYPLHLLSILLLLRLYGQTSLYSGHALALNLLLLQGPWLPQVTWNYPSWSISAEWHAYLLFPVFCAGLWRLPAKAAAAVAIACALALVLTCAESEWGLANVTNGPLSLARALPEFITGMLAYRAYRTGWCRALWQSDLFLASIAVAILALSCAWPTDLAIILLLPGVLLAAATNEGRAKSLLISRPLQFLGDISYSLYMIHYTCIIAIFDALFGVDSAGAPTAPRIMAFFAAIALSLGFATALSRGIEYPARSALRRLWAGEIGERSPAGR
ncbi:MAG TPA: acyltransferase [Stellaceae bacterium]|nr:acyltransferase [Stellaceae bacterium]